MTQVFGAFGPQAFVVLIVGIIGLVPVALYYSQIPSVIALPYAFLMAAAIATNIENVVLPDVLNLTEHYVGNLGAGVSFAVAAYLYRQRYILDDGDDRAAESPAEVTDGS